MTGVCFDTFLRCQSNIIIVLKLKEKRVILIILFPGLHEQFTISVESVEEYTMLEI